MYMFQKQNKKTMRNLSFIYIRYHEGISTSNFSLKKVVEIDLMFVGLFVIKALEGGCVA